MNNPLGLINEILAQPLWLQLWMAWMGLVNFAALFFLQEKVARWVLIAMVVNVTLMSTLYALNGYNRLLGLPHVLTWTPLLIMLYRNQAWRSRQDAFGKWLPILFATNLISLVVDYSDVVRYLLGDRS